MIIHVVVIEDYSDYTTQTSIDSLHKSWSSAAHRVKVLNKQFENDPDQDLHAYYFMKELIER